MATLYEILGVATDAAPSEIKKAHRRLVKEHHPDKGGDPETFAKIQEAYEVLSDEGRRARYDSTGEYGQVKDRFKEQLMGFIQQVILPEIENSRNFEFDLIGSANKVIRNTFKEGNRKVADVKEAKEKLEASLERISRKGDGDNLIADVIRGQIGTYERGIENMEHELEILGQLKEEINQYEWEFEPEHSEDDMEKIAERMQKWLDVEIKY